MYTSFFPSDIHDMTGSFFVTAFDIQKCCWPIYREQIYNHKCSLCIISLFDRLFFKNFKINETAVTFTLSRFTKNADFQCPSADSTRMFVVVVYAETSWLALLLTSYTQIKIRFWILLLVSFSLAVY